MTSKHPNINRNSALYWYPKISTIASELPVNLPKSVFVEYDFRDSWALLDGEKPPSLPWEKFTTACEEIGFPTFIRTDQKSAKHSGPTGYLAENPDDILRVTANLTDHHVREGRHPAALMFREFIPINSQFRAFGGLPIGQELRFFATPQNVVSEHFYWPDEAIEQSAKTPTELDGETELPDHEWKDRLHSLSNIEEDELSLLRATATDAVVALNDSPNISDETSWSVDFAKDTAGEWWLIDTALSEDSWHPEAEQ